MARRRVMMSWSGGKDGAVALWRLQADPDCEAVGLLSTVSEETGRVAMHGFADALLHAQAAVLGLPLHTVPLPVNCPNTVYEQRMGRAVARARADGVDAFAFGDLFLEDIRAYRECMLAPTGMAALFPLWGTDTAALAEEVIDAGFRARLCSIDPGRMPAAALGSEFDRALLATLPPGVDPCGENGEFHTLVFDAPNFPRPVAHRVGEAVERDGFRYIDLRPDGGEAV